MLPAEHTTTNGAPMNTSEVMNVPHRAPDVAKSQGGVGGRCIKNPRLAASELRMHLMAIRKRWKVKDEYLETLADDVAELARETEDHRVKLGCMNILRALHKDNQDADVAEDKMLRLDAGQNTDQVGHVMRFVKGVDADAI